MRHSTRSALGGRWYAPPATFGGSGLRLKTWLVPRDSQGHRRHRGHFSVLVTSARRLEPTLVGGRRAGARVGAGLWTLVPPRSGQSRAGASNGGAEFVSFRRKIRVVIRDSDRQGPVTSGGARCRAVFFWIATKNHADSIYGFARNSDSFPCSGGFGEFSVAWEDGVLGAAHYSRVGYACSGVRMGLDGPRRPMLMACYSVDTKPRADLLYCCGVRGRFGCGCAPGWGARACISLSLLFQVGGDQGKPDWRTGKGKRERDFNGHAQVRRAPGGCGSPTSAAPTGRKQAGRDGNSTFGQCECAGGPSGSMASICVHTVLARAAATALAQVQARPP